MRVGLYRRELIEKTGVAPHTIRYLFDLGRLPVIRGSCGPGIPLLFDPEAVEIINQHLAKSRGEPHGSTVNAGDDVGAED